MRTALVAVPVTSKATTHSSSSSSSSSRQPRGRHARIAPRAALDCGEIACAFDEDVAARSVVINGATVRARAIRDVQVVNADGARVTIVSTFGDASGKNVLVVLRHLG